ncbi:FecR domain-containing protein [Pseudomonas sp. V1]|uniref:FecR domain-containing protein n=1 Tax=Pseudomonas arcuscaelestis TaxID=2710591 RepID=UPI00193FB2F8|nr:FecR domain-containing protein [Pseudomonas arcuscaelestis]MBM3106234.1 FecR domain-containing protein [Pseudomonas arcuscaelestis]
MSADGRPELPDEVLDQAIAWKVRLQSGDADDRVRQGCLQWRQARPVHEAAWQALQASESAFHGLATLSGASSRVALDTLERMQRGRIGRRRLLQVVGGGLVMGGMGWEVHRGALAPWNSDYTTQVGERRSFKLADGTRLQINTSSAVDVAFSQHKRVLTLQRGEIFIDTGADDGAPGGRRGFWVQTPQASLEALGTAFAVRQEQDQTRLRVEEHAVVIHHAVQRQRVEAGEEYVITANGLSKVTATDMDASAWTRGQLVASRMRIRDLVAEFARYQRGWISCDRQIANVEVSGVFQLDDIDRALNALGDSLPVRIERFTSLWRRVVAR